MISGSRRVEVPARWGSNEVCLPDPFQASKACLRTPWTGNVSSIKDADCSTGVATMGEQDESVRRSPFLNNNGVDSSTRTVPILHPTIQTSAPSPGDPMDVTSPTMVTMGPPARSSPEDEANGSRDHNGMMEDQAHTSGMLGPNAAVAAQAGAQQPKVVQTAFIHKLYKSVLGMFFLRN